MKLTTKILIGLGLGAMTADSQHFFTRIVHYFR